VKDVIASYETLLYIFERIQLFLQRLNHYTAIRLTLEMTELLGKIMAQVLSVLAFSTKAMKERRISECFHFARPPLVDYGTETVLKRLVGKTDVEDALARLDALTKEENLMAVARTLEVVHHVDDSVTTIKEIIHDVDGNVKAMKELTHHVDQSVSVIKEVISDVGSDAKVTKELTYDIHKNVAVTEELVHDVRNDVGVIKKETHSVGHDVKVIKHGAQHSFEVFCMFVLTFPCHTPQSSNRYTATFVIPLRCHRRPSWLKHAYRESVARQASNVAHSSESFDQS